MPTILAKADGWAFYLKPFDVTFELILYFVAIGLFAAVGATVLAALAAPFLLRDSSRERIADIVLKTAVCVAVFVDGRMLLGSLLYRVGLQSGARFLVLAFYAAFVVAVLVPRSRAKVAGSLDQWLTAKTTRRAVIGLGAATAGIIATEAVVGKLGAAPSRPLAPARRQAGNILLITFDALSAEDMSVYGYRLPTTPKIDQFAAQSTVFDNYYSTSTFTTPSVASILTSLQISEHHVYQLQGRLSEALRLRTLPYVMKAGGFATGAVISNPHAFLFNGDLADGYDVMPDMAYNPIDRDLWNATAALHQFEGPGSRDTEFWDLVHVRELAPNAAEKYAPRYFSRLKSGFPASASFDQARAAIQDLPEGYFMWVHLMAPHSPYLPDPKHAGKFLPTGEMRTETEQDSIPYTNVYSPNVQPVVDRARLRYDEFLCDADAAFADFMGQLEKGGKLRNTTVMVSADHGESFEGGVYTHNSRFLTRPQLHVPLIVRTPGQTQGRRVKVTADHTSLAPTIIELAGLQRPAWMTGTSLVPWLSGDRDGAGEGIAFCQFLENASVFHPINAGVVGVICGGQQYTLNLGDGAIRLRSVAEAHIWNRDHSAENPALAREMRAKLAARFPEIPQLRG